MARLANISLLLKASFRSSLIVFVVVLVFSNPALADASVSSVVSSWFTNTTEAADIPNDTKPSRTPTSQNIDLPTTVLSVDSSFSGGDLGVDIPIVDRSALMAAAGPMGTLADIDEFSPGNADTISVYVVRSGDTIQGIAKMFGVSVNTVLWGNDLKSAKSLKVGQELVILPVTGIKYTIKKGDTIAGIAKKYKGDVDEILDFNNIEKGSKLVVGDEIIIPNGEAIVSAPTIKGTSKIINTYIDGAIDSFIYYMRPVVSGRKTQGLHGKNGVDIAPACKCVGKEPLIAAASGTVIVARNSGWNGGYGNYVVISHPNGTQTLYGHMYSVIVSPGQRVDKGERIGYVGSSGNSTGPHVHFEIRGAINPF